jgi:hypothetical protein
MRGKSLLLAAIASLAITSASIGAPTLVQNYVDPSCMRPDENKLQTHHCYQNSDGNVVHGPSRRYDGLPPIGATARCRDGTMSFSEHRSGTCSHHGGIAN